MEEYIKQLEKENVRFDNQICDLLEENKKLKEENKALSDRIEEFKFTESGMNEIMALTEPRLQSNEELLLIVKTIHHQLLCSRDIEVSLRKEIVKLQEDNEELKEENEYLNDRILEVQSYNFDH